VTIPRQAEAALIDIVTGTAYHIFTTITSEKVQIDGVEMLPKGVEPGITLEELIAAEEAVKADPRVQKYAADVGVKPEEIFADGWSIGWDDRLWV
jgi:primary-amine oxidase